MRIITILLCLIISGLTACASINQNASHSRQAQLDAKYLGSDLYRVGRHIYHRPEWRKPEF